MKKLISPILVLIVVFSTGCRRGEKIAVEEKILDGVVHVYNPEIPQKGQITLLVKEVLRIDSLDIDADDPPVLDLYARDSENHILICDRRTPRMYRFSPDGRLENKFLEKGEGPGEFPRGIYAFQVLNDNLWLSHSRKLVCLKPNGAFSGEWKFDRNITFIEMVDPEKMIGNIYKKDLTEERTRVCAVFDRNGVDMATLLENRNAGFTEIRMQNNDNIRILRFFSAAITSDILHIYDPENKRVYLYLSGEYQIYRKDLRGNSDLVIHRNYQPVDLTDQDKTDIIDEIFSNWSPEQRQLLKDVFPKKFAAINRIALLPNGHIAVRRILGFQKHALDVYDYRGRFVYTLKPPPELPGFYRTDLSGTSIWVFREIDDRDVFILYEMTNLPV